MKGTALIWVLAVLTVLPATTAHAWNDPTHMAIAALAFDGLNPAEQARWGQILLHHPDCARLTRALGTRNPSPRLLVMAASTWPDLIKGSREYQDNGYQETGPLTTVHADFLMHKGWHFIDQPLSLDGTRGTVPEPDSTSVDAVTVLSAVIRQLQEPQPAPEQAYQLAWLEHLVGDLHQPLHCVTGVSATLPSGDRGGNEVIIHNAGRPERNLHAYWDDILGEGWRRSTGSSTPALREDAAIADRIIGQLPAPAPSPDATDLRPAVWARACLKLASQFVYRPLQLAPALGHHQGQAVARLQAQIPPGYGATAKSVAQQQILLAAQRLRLLVKRVLDRDLARSTLPAGG